MSTVDLRAAVRDADDGTVAWSNWTGDQRCRPARIARPCDLDEVREALAQAASHGAVVRVAGAGHSFSDAVLTDGHLLSLEHMNGVLDVDRSAGLVRVQGGMTINALSETLTQHGLAMQNLGDIDVQAVAGAVATATHGTGLRYPNVSSFVESVELVRGDGQLVELDARDGDAFLAARVNLGALGVVTALTFRVVPAFTLRRVDAPQPLGEVLEQLDELPERHSHWEFFCFPHTGVALTRTSEEVDSPPQPPGRLRRRLLDVWLTNRAFEAFCRAGRRAPRLIPRLNRAVTRLAGSAERVDVSHRVFASPRLVRFTEMETSVPREHARAAVGAALEAAARYPVNFPIEVRFSAGDDALLSMAHGRDSCFVAVHAYRGMPWQQYFRDVQDALGAFGGRPHWGKRTSLTHRELRERYPRWDDFQAVRRAMDPDGRFANRYVRRLLGA